MRAYVGGYTTADRDGRGDGINVYRLDPETGAGTHLQHLGELENPSLFTLRGDGRVLYSVHGARPLLSAFAIDAASGEIRLLNQQPCGGTNPVDTALDAASRFLIVANYGSGGVAVLTLAPDGALGGLAQVFGLPGTPGPHPTEQTSSHPHGVIFDPSGQFVIVPDKGFDCVFVFRFDAVRGELALHQTVAARPGAGPRHCVFHPRLPVLYVNNELDSTVTLHRWDQAAGTLTAEAVVDSLPPGTSADNTTAEIAVTPDGRFLYVSNRGHDSISAFAIAPETGRLDRIGCTPTGGRKPRFFTLDPAGRLLLAANQDSDTIVAFRIDTASGALTPTGAQIRVGSPSAITLIA